MIKQLVQELSHKNANGYVLEMKQPQVMEQCPSINGLINVSLLLNAMIIATNALKLTQMFASLAMKDKL